MEFQLTLLILIPLGLLAYVLVRYALRPLWCRTVDRYDTLDREEARDRHLREEAERELREGHETR